MARRRQLPAHYDRTLNGARHHAGVYRNQQRKLCAAVMVAAVLAATGCSAQTDYGNNPSGVATSYFHRLYNRDFAGACQLFTDQLRSHLGDCPGALSRARDELPVAERDELRDTSVSLAVHQTKDSAQVRTTDVTITSTTTPRVVKGTPKPRSTQVRSLAANHVTNGPGLQLTKVGTAWKISDCGL
jgi:hypothetical protein